MLHYVMQLYIPNHLLPRLSAPDDGSSLLGEPLEICEAVPDADAVQQTDGAKGTLPFAPVMVLVRMSQRNVLRLIRLELEACIALCSSIRRKDAA